MKSANSQRRGAKELSPRPRRALLPRPAEPAPAAPLVRPELTRKMARRAILAPELVEIGPVWKRGIAREGILAIDAVIPGACRPTGASPPVRFKAPKCRVRPPKRASGGGSREAGRAELLEPARAEVRRAAALGRSTGPWRISSGWLGRRAGEFSSSSTMTELESLRRRDFRPLVGARVLGAIGEVSESITITSEAWFEVFRKAGPISTGDDAEAAGSLISGTSLTTSSPCLGALVLVWRVLVMKLKIQAALTLLQNRTEVVYP